jgi:DNA-binding NarL/FixJ family response regulator
VRAVDVDMGVNRQAIGYDERPRQDQRDQVGLTGRELSVLSLVAQGYLGQEICEELFLGISTVSRRLVAARVKLGARTTAQAVAIAVRAGLLDEDGCE